MTLSPSHSSAFKPYTTQSPTHNQELVATFTALLQVTSQLQRFYPSKKEDFSHFVELRRKALALILDDNRKRNLNRTFDECCASLPIPGFIPLVIRKLVLALPASQPLDLPPSNLVFHRSCFETC